MHEVNSEQNLSNEETSNSSASEVNWNTNSLQKALQALKVEVPQGIKSSKISIDTRTISKEDIFIGIEGPNYNGSNFAKDAIAKGASLCIINKSSDLRNVNLLDEARIITVDDTKTALAMLASYNRERVNPKVIGVTGSYGKTTTKELIRKALKDLYEVYANPGNYNNDIGLPLSIANMPQSVEIAIFEMGMSAAGEIEFLSKIAKPDIAVITSIGDAHAANFSSIAGIASAKSEIFAGMKENGVAIINIDNPYKNILSTAASDQKLHCIKYGEQEEADIRIISRNEDNINLTTKLSIEVKKRVYNLTLHSISDAVVKNVMPVLSILVELEADIEYAIMQIEQFEEIKGRGRILRHNGKMIIDDSYNASPVPMKAAIEVLGRLDSTKKKVAVIGDMLELGVHEIQHHENLFRCIVDSKIDFVVTVGSLMHSLISKLPEFVHYKHFTAIDKINDEDLENIRNLGDIFLFKASFGIGLHKLLKSFLKEQNA